MKLAVVIAWRCLSATTPLSLAAAQAEARAHAPDGALLEARLNGARLEAAASGRVFLTNPMISGSLMPLALAPGSDEIDWGAALTMTFDVSGSWVARGQSGKANLEKAREEQSDGLRALDEAVAIALADLIFAEHAVERGERIAALFAVAADAARKLLATGQGGQLDVDAADLDAAAATATTEVARGQLGSAHARFCRLLGRNHCVDLAVDAGAPPKPDTVAGGSETLVDADPRLKAAEAERNAAELEERATGRQAWPGLTLGLHFDSSQHAIPASAFRGAAGLSAEWLDRDLRVSLSVPLPIFERRQTERARATTRKLVAEAQVARIRAVLHEELQSARATVVAAERVYIVLADTPAIIAREFMLLEKAIHAGAVDAVARAVALRRLQEADARFDLALRELRVAHAQWVRRTALF